jgi:hypothetical protein
MAVWVTALKLIPWKDVITHAPVVADGARKLWNSVGKKSEEGRRTGGTASPEPGPAALTEGGIEVRVGAMDRDLAELREQMVASSELIKQLAEQNTMLVQRIEANRIRVAWLTAATAVAGIVAVLALVLR